MSVDVERLRGLLAAADNSKGHLYGWLHQDCLNARLELMGLAPALLDEIVALRAESEGRRVRLEAAVESALAAEAERDTLRTQLTKAVEALGPFALVAEKDIGDSEDDIDRWRPVDRNWAPHILVSDLRKARTTLTEITSDGGGK